MYTITYDCGGRLGNSLFPFFLCILFEMKYGYIYTEVDQPNQYTLDDVEFRKYVSEEKFLTNTITLPPCNLRLWGFFQYDWIFKHFRKELMEYVTKIPRYLNIMAKSSNISLRSDQILADALPDINPGPNDLVVHLRLEDSVEERIAWIIPPNNYDDVLKTIKYEKLYWVLNEPKLPVEKRFLAYCIKKWGGTHKVQTVLEDMTLMRKAHRLVCSRSSLSWMSSYLSFHEKQEVWIPEDPEHWIHEDCRGIYPNTHEYPIQRINKTALEHFLDTHE